MRYPAALVALLFAVGLASCSGENNKPTPKAAPVVSTAATPLLATPARTPAATRQT